MRQSDYLRMNVNMLKSNAAYRLDKTAYVLQCIWCHIVMVFLSTKFDLVVKNKSNSA